VVAVKFAEGLSRLRLV